MGRPARGTFEIQLEREAPYDVEDGVSLGRSTGQKRFEGDLEGISAVHMLGVLTPTEGSAGYVAIERVIGRLAGRSGTFVLQHSGAMARGSQQLRIEVVPDSGTGELTGLRGNMTIEITGGEHFYVFDFELDGASSGASPEPRK
jgi:hypothetical protein